MPITFRCATRGGDDQFRNPGAFSARCSAALPPRKLSVAAAAGEADLMCYLDWISLEEYASPSGELTKRSVKVETAKPVVRCAECGHDAGAGAMVVGEKTICLICWSYPQVSK